MYIFAHGGIFWRESSCSDYDVFFISQKLSDSGNIFKLPRIMKYAYSVLKFYYWLDYFVQMNNIILTRRFKQ
jgi:hypothetical protein